MARIHHICSINSSADGNLGCSHFFDYYAQCCYWGFKHKLLCGMFSFLLDECRRVELLGHTLTLHLTSQGTDTLLSKAVSSFIFPPAVCEGPRPFPHFFTNTDYCLSRWGWSSWCFGFAFLWWLMSSSISPCTCWPLVQLPQRNVPWSFA
jgi:hypothetical protein